MTAACSFYRIAAGAVLAISIVAACGCASGPDKLRKDRNKGLENGDFLSALAYSRDLYRRGTPTLPDLAAHCGLVFAVANYTEARECVDVLLHNLAVAEQNQEAQFEAQVARYLEHPPGSRRLPPDLEAAVRAGVLRKGKLVPRWRETRYGVETRLALHDVRWRALYLSGKIHLETGDYDAAKATFAEARQLVITPWSVPGSALTLAALLEGRQSWSFKDVLADGSVDARAWWIDLLSALSVASSASGDTTLATATIEELHRFDPPRALAGYKQSRLAFAYRAAGRLAEAKKAADADPEQFRRHLRVGGGILSGGILLFSLLAASAFLAVPAASIAAAMSATIGAVASVVWGVALSALTFTVSRVAGQDTSWDLAQRWYAVATIARATGNDKKADEIYDKLLAEGEILQSQPAIQWQVYADIAQAHEKAGRDNDAIEFYQRSIDVIEATRRNIALESAKIGFITDKQHVYQRLMHLRLKHGQVSEAFELSEQARARALLDVLASRDWTAAADPALTQNSELVKQLEAQESEVRLSILQQQPKETSLRRTAIRQLSDRLEQRHPQLAALTHVKRYRIQEIRNRLLPGEVLVSFVPIGDRLVAFALSASALRTWSMEEPAVFDAVSRLREAIDQRIDTADLSSRLARDLFADLAAMGDYKLLTIVPTGRLHALPFVVLRRDAGPLRLDASLRVLPSASVLPLLDSQSRDAAPISITAFGNPDFGGRYPALPSSEGEVRSVAAIVGTGRVLLGRDANVANVHRHAGTTTVLHFATHGYFDAERPLQSALYLSDGQGGAQTITASDFYGMRIAARLVAMSACETGLGSVKSGDEVIGLYRALMFAGAYTIVASLWEVDDESTSFLMTRFYGHLKHQSASQALHLAQQEAAIRWPDPYYWAGFVVIGLDRPFAESTSARVDTNDVMPTPANEASAR